MYDFVVTFFLSTDTDSTLCKLDGYVSSWSSWELLLHYKPLLEAYRCALITLFY